MTFTRTALTALLLTSLACVGVVARAATVTYTSKPDFLTAIGGAPSIVDDYSNPGYLSGDIANGPTLDRFSDAGMSNVIHQVAYSSTGGTNVHFTVGPALGYTTQFYQPQSSALLDFRFTTVGSSSGVYGVGFDYYTDPVYLFVTYGDNSFANVLLSGGTSSSQAFFGITSDKLIKSIHFGGFGGTSDPLFFVTLDNLTFGGAPSAVPLPAAAWLLISGMGALGAFARRRRGS